MNEPMNEPMSGKAVPEGWRPMSSAPRDGTIILVCELPGGQEVGQVMPACYMRANGDPAMEGFWGAWPTGRVPSHLMARYPNEEGFVTGWRSIALTPLCWQPLPTPESFATLRRRQGQLLRARAS
jgi:hypothetical protein